ncbi:MAG: PSD1 domain-containing protein [Planctomycetaceae bacterium]|nr:PSD1 domain-containing protein [Planctomycetales bacterium]MCB9923145.1 PSD1 domain-containing protein [Planctomycetaceae bacterium]
MRRLHSNNLVLIFALLFAPFFASANDNDFFEKKIRPVLVDRCYRCHSEAGESVKGGLRLDSRDGVRRGGDSGAAVVPGDVEASLLVSAIRYESYEMPPEGRLPDDVIADFETWIKTGAHDPRDTRMQDSLATEIDWEAARSFWAFQPPKAQTIPECVPGESCRGAIDAFVLRRLSESTLTANPEASRRILIRRVTLDLIGLPPTPEEVEAFVADEAPDAYERLIDQLLASPHYGERWARLWLDVARYAEDQAHIVGNNTSLCYPNAYLYRDWVIDAVNEDLPYDTFVRQQLAADLVNPMDEASHVALGFIGLGPKYYRRNDVEVMAEEWEDRVDTVARGLLGLTVACARCHDHKYDPIPTEDYYALAGVFASTEMFNRPLDDKRELEKNGQTKKAEDAVHIVRDAKPLDLNVFIRGDVKKKGEVAKRRFPRILCSTEKLSSAFETGSGRLELANSIVTRDNPLTARVFVNRVWGQLFGKPLVGTPSNFGSLGERPTHPELLDDLAVRFMDSGWSLKWLQREIVLSSTYRQSTDIDPAKQRIDPDNKLLWRMNRRRLSVEVWRDTLLSIGDRLQLQIGGASIDPQNPDERRRTVYSRISRLELDAMLALFDFPDPNVHSPRRNETTTPLQKLFVLNSPFMVRQAESYAKRVTEASAADIARIRVAYQVSFGRPPSSDEVAIGLEFLEGCDEVDELARWTQYAQILFASNELLMVD